MHVHLLPPCAGWRAGAARPLRHRDVHEQPEAGWPGGRVPQSAVDLQSNVRQQHMRHAPGNMSACTRRGAHIWLPSNSTFWASNHCPVLPHHCPVLPHHRHRPAGPGLPHPVRLHRPRLPAAQDQRAAGGAAAHAHCPCSWPHCCHPRQLPVPAEQWFACLLPPCAVPLRLPSLSALRLSCRVLACPLPLCPP